MTGLTVFAVVLCVVKEPIRVSDMDRRLRMGKCGWSNSTQGLLLWISEEIGELPGLSVAHVQVVARIDRRYGRCTVAWRSSGDISSFLDFRKRQ